MTIAEQLIEKGKLEGLEKGKAEAMKLAHQMKVEAEQKGIEKVAINMLLQKVDEKVISESTGFSVKDLQKLKKEKLAH